MPLTLKYITQGIIVRERCQRNIIQGKVNIPQIVVLTKDEAGLLPNRNTILKHTHIPIIMARRLTQEARKEDSPIKGIPFSCNSKRTT